jgi:hypothetical protein
MSAISYHGGHSLADILDEWGGHSLVRQQEYLAGMIECGEIAITPQLPEGWRLQRVEVHQSTGMLRARHRVMIETDSERYELYEFRCHFPRPEPRRPPDPPAPPPSFEEQMIERLVERLKRHQARSYTKAKAFYRKLFKRVFNLSAKKFDETVWPVATKAPGVKTPQAGAPSKKK